MRAKAYLLGLGSFLVAVQAACGPGPGLGLGPTLDPVVSLVVAGVLLVGGYWLVKSVSSLGPAKAISKGISAAEDNFREDTPERLRRQRQLPTAEEILRERYGRGEIGRKQYLEMLDNLGKR
ncbi:MAG: hypothetical protein WCC87_04435 [Candidatus Korobacteraceae bacterium]